MKKEIIFIFSIFILLFITIPDTNALSTYVGVKILDMKDDPSAHCINNGYGDYGPQGRIRAISSVLPDYPIFFNLTKQSDGTQIWAGDSTKDSDYTIGDMFFLPSAVDLISGEDYNLMFDIDAIKIYLPLPDYISFKASDNDEYWTMGKINTDNEYCFRQNHGCEFYTSIVGQFSNICILIASSRDQIDNSCSSDGTDNNCRLTTNSFPVKKYDFNILDQYDNLYQDDVGNFNLVFTIP